MKGDGTMYVLLQNLIRALLFLGIARQVHAMPRTVNDDPLQKFMYRVRIPGYPAALGFTKVGSFVREMGVVEYAEGMFEFFHKLSGRQKVTDIEFERGAYRDNHAYNLYAATLNDPKSRTTVTVEVMDRYQRVAREYVLANAWCSKLEVDGLDASSDEVLVDKMTITFEFFLNDKTSIRHVAPGSG